MAQTNASKANETASAMADDAAELARSEIAALRERVEELLSERVGPALSGVAERAEHAAHAAAGAVNRQKRIVAHNIRSQPFAAVGVAALAGLAIGLLMRR